MLNPSKIVSATTAAQILALHPKIHKIRLQKITIQIVGAMLEQDP